MSAAHLLAAGITQLDLNVSPSQQQLLLDYLSLLQQWNQHFNLTAIDQIEQMITQHLLDSLSLLPFIRGKNILDIGSGAGLPGIPLAIAQADLTVTLLDSNLKKTRFMQQVAIELGLGNIRIVRTRLETYRPATTFDTICSRAFATLHAMISQCQPLFTPTTRILAMKGRYPAAELAELAVPTATQITTQALSVPGLDAARHIVIIEHGKTK